MLDAEDLKSPGGLSKTSPSVVYNAQLASSVRHFLTYNPLPITPRRANKVHNPIVIPYEGWRIICLQCVQMTCKKCMNIMKHTRRPHMHQVNLCRIITTLRPGNGRRCQGCGRGKHAAPPIRTSTYTQPHTQVRQRHTYTELHPDHPSQGFSGLQCTNCHKWELCSNCLVNRTPVRHRTCEQRMTVWELIIPSSSPAFGQGGSSRAQKVLRKVGENPVFATTAALVALFAAAQLEDVIDD